MIDKLNNELSLRELLIEKLQTLQNKYIGTTKEINLNEIINTKYELEISVNQIGNSTIFFKDTLKSLVEFLKEGQYELMQNSENTFKSLIVWAGKCEIWSLRSKQSAIMNNQKMMIKFEMQYINNVRESIKCEFVAKVL